MTGVHTKRKKRQLFRSVVEFEKEYFPKAFEKKMVQRTADARAAGARLARESLGKIMKQLPTQAGLG